MLTEQLQALPLTFAADCTTYYTKFFIDDESETDTMPESPGFEDYFHSNR
jgi:hypothetical protein